MDTAQLPHFSLLTLKLPCQPPAATLGMNSITTRTVRLLATLAIASLFLIIQAHAFLSPLPRPRPFLVPTRSTTSRSSETDQGINDAAAAAEDESLLKSVTKKQLQELCQQTSLSDKGTKEVMLKRLRDHAADQAALEHQRSLERVKRVEEGSDDPKQRYEITNDYETDVDEEDEDAGFFYFNTPEAINVTKPAEKPRKKEPVTWHSSAISAPPPPTEPNEDGERVVQIYSTKDQNDMTGIAAAQPGQAALGGDALSNTVSSGGAQPWDMDQSATTSETSSKEMQEAKEKVIELVQALLAMSGAPAFVGFAEDLENLPAFEAPKEFVGFNPSQVPAEFLTASSQALRTGRGQALQDVLRQFEMQGIGQDGMAGDKVKAGGGHYREVCKVRAFLEGYRRAEVRRLARETTALMLDKLVQEGVEGLDFTLASMTRSSDDTSDHAGELNDSLLDYLNDAIRQQEKKVDQIVAAKLDKLSPGSAQNEYDPIEGLWNVTSEDGQRIESIDPNDKNVQRVLQEEFKKEEYMKAEMVSPTSDSVGDSAPEQLLLLLTLLRERIKAEAAFAPDEKGRNLRLLAYCLRVSTDSEREQLILKDAGNSLDVSNSELENSVCYAYGSATLDPTLTVLLAFHSVWIR